MLRDDSPAAGVELELRGWTANRERERIHGLPDAWSAPTGRSDEDGRFALRFEAPRAFQFSLDAESPGLMHTSWRWDAIQSGDVVDLGEVRLLPGGTIEGSIVDGAGRALTGTSWLVSVTQGESSSGARDETFLHGRSDSATGEFRIEGLPPGRAKLEATHSMGGKTDTVTVLVPTGGRVRADLVYEGVSFGNRILVTTSSQPFSFRETLPEDAVRLLEANGSPASAQRSRPSSSRFAFDGLAVGDYSVEIDHPDYLPWREDGVRPGQRVRASLRGSAGLRVRLLDADGRPQEHFAAGVRYRGDVLSRNEVRVHDGVEALVDGLLDGLFPGDLTLTVTSSSGGGQVEVDGLAPGETRDVVIELGRSTVIHGNVTRAGRPVGGVEVQLIRPAEQGDSNTSLLIPLHGTVLRGAERCRFQLGVTATDDQGRFRFDAAEGGDFLVLAKESGGVTCWAERFHVPVGQWHELNLRLPGVGSLLGRLRVPAGASPKGLRVWVQAAGLDWREMGSSFMNEAVTLDETGTFEIGPLVAGEARVHLFLPAKNQSGYSGGGDGPHGARLLGTITIPELGTIEREFDAPDFPGLLQVLLDGVDLPVQGLSVRLVAGPNDQIATAPGPRGQTQKTPLFPGTWRLFVVAPKQAWSQEYPTPVTVQSGVEQVIRFEVRTFEASVTLIDVETREPLRNRKVAFSPHYEDGVGPTMFNTYVETNEQGQLHLDVPAGQYRLHLGELQVPRDGDPREAILTWTHQGPTGAEIDL